MTEPRPYCPHCDDDEPIIPARQRTHAILCFALREAIPDTKQRIQVTDRALDLFEGNGVGFRCIPYDKPVKDAAP
jgi:hypothetical protein